MGLWDKLRNRKEESADPGPAEQLDDPGTDWFRPTVGRPYTGPDGEQLTFSSLQVVHTRPEHVTLTGEYTSSGRFTTVATFERPVVFTVADPVAGDPPVTEAFVARRTDTADASSVEVRYVLLERD